jgi:undecaprenyl-diphosphatase
MQYLFSIILGIVQGLSEFLPISSSGHLLVFEKLLAPLGYNSVSSSQLLVMLHMGTLFAVAVVFWNDWVDMLLHPIKNKTLGLLFIASLPALFAVVLLGDLFDTIFEGWFLGPAFLLTALFMWLAEKVSQNGKKKSDEVDVKAALTMGGFQAIALLPGVSRSGSTVLGGMVAGLTRKKAAAFSFMMSAPAILGGFLKEVKDAAETTGLSSLFSGPILVGVLVSAVVGYLAIRFMLKVIEHKSLNGFAYYLIAVGVIVIIFQLTGTLDFPPIKLPTL